VLAFKFEKHMYRTWHSR